MDKTFQDRDTCYISFGYRSLLKKAWENCRKHQIVVNAPEPSKFDKFKKMFKAKEVFNEGELKKFDIIFGIMTDTEKVLFNRIMTVFLLMLKCRPIDDINKGNLDDKDTCKDIPENSMYVSGKTLGSLVTDVSNMSDDRKIKKLFTTLLNLFDVKESDSGNRLYRIRIFSNSDEAKNQVFNNDTINDLKTKGMTYNGIVQEMENNPLKKELEFLKIDPAGYTEKEYNEYLNWEQKILTEKNVRDDVCLYLDSIGQHRHKDMINTIESYINSFILEYNNKNETDYINSLDIDLNIAKGIALMLQYLPDYSNPKTTVQAEPRKRRNSKNNRKKIRSRSKTTRRSKSRLREIREIRKLHKQISKKKLR